MSGPFPQNYEEWRYCITEKCGISLTPTFISQRLTVWRNENLEETKNFRRLYGDSHWQDIIRWFEIAEQDSQTT